MCTVCGCSEAGVVNNADTAHPAHSHKHQTNQHSHSHSHDLDSRGQLHFGSGPAGVDVAGLSQHRLLDIETDILASNNRYAAENRMALNKLDVYAINLLSSPGSGKTSLLCKTIESLPTQALAVIEGDQQTARDAERIRNIGAPAVQINTGKGCHLDAHMVGHALDSLPLVEGGMLFIENVGNLVCPSAFDLGEACKATVLSVTEGEDKPLKYPDIFTASQLAIISKIDLAPHCDVDLALIKQNLRRVNPDIDIVCLSARTGEGMSDWLDWLLTKHKS